MDQPTMSEATTTPHSTDAEVHAARAALYGALGGVFVYPDEETLSGLTDPEALSGVASAAATLGLDEEASELIDALSGTTLAELQSAYDRTLGLPEGGEYPVVPYEGYYTTGSEMREEQTRIATVVGLLEEFGLQPGEEFDERQDHVATELELMQVVAAQRAVAVERGEAGTGATLAGAEATILDTHLVDFVPAFAHDLRATSDERVYCAAARLAESLVTADHAAHHDGDDWEVNTRE